MLCDDIMGGESYQASLCPKQDADSAEVLVHRFEPQGLKRRMLSVDSLTEERCYNCDSYTGCTVFSLHFAKQIQRSPPNETRKIVSPVSQKVRIETALLFLLLYEVVEQP